MIRTLVCVLLLSCYFSLPAVAAIDLNIATQTELEEVKGIGPVKAKAIIDYRKQHGNFKSVDELDNVRGIGEATVIKLKKELFVIHKKPANNRIGEIRHSSITKKHLNVKSIKADRPAKEPSR